MQFGYAHFDQPNYAINNYYIKFDKHVNKYQHFLYT